jgi:Lipase (class 3)
MIPFNPSVYQECDRPQKKFDSSQARKLAGLIQQAYVQYDRFVENPKAAKPFVQLDQNLQLKELYENNTPFGFVASETNTETNSKDVFVVFRGTRKFIEWFKDVNIPLVNYGDGKTEKGYGLKVIAELLQEFEAPAQIEKSDQFGLVALGFRQIYTSLRKAMIDALEDCDPNSRIFVTGHSLGGALATLAIPDIIKNTQFKDPKNIKLYTFASPRCGDSTFAKAFNATGVEHWRIANTEDMVTMIPFPTGNIFKIKSANPENQKPADGGGTTGDDKNPNPLFGFFNDMYERSQDTLRSILNGQKKRMPDYCHTGTPVYFTFNEAALERHHNLDEVYMIGIGVDKLPKPIPSLPEPAI